MEGEKQREQSAPQATESTPQPFEVKEYDVSCKYILLFLYVFRYSSSFSPEYRCYLFNPSRFIHLQRENMEPSLSVLLVYSLISITFVLFISHNIACILA